MRRQFKDTVMRLAEQDDRLLLWVISVFLFNDFSSRHPDRLHNVGICENTLISMAAGLSATGFYPVVHTIAPFVTERSYEQVKLDMCYNGFGCTIVTTGGSFDYAWDGATHHCYTDLELMRMLPDMQVMQPGSKKEFDILLQDVTITANLRICELPLMNMDSICRLYLGMELLLRKHLNQKLL